GTSGTCEPCIPRTTCPDGQTTGTAPDGCGGTINCGPCAPGTGHVDARGILQCTCQGATTCPPNVCGVAPDGCGCGGQWDPCPGGQNCELFDGSSFGICSLVCHPATNCPTGQNCGVAPDGCGGTINCGVCVNNEVCRDGQCVACVPRTMCPGGQQCGTAPD